MIVSLQVILWISNFITVSHTFGITVPITTSRSILLTSSRNTILMASSSTSPKADTDSGFQPFAVNLKLKIKEERRKDFLSLIKNNQKETLDLEPASLQYVIGEDIDTSNTFYIHEEFIGINGFDVHSNMLHNADWVKFKNSNSFVKGGEPMLNFYYDDAFQFEDVNPQKIPIRSAFCVHVELCIKPEERNEFLNVIAQNQKGSLETEPLCLQYVYGESLDEKNKFIFHEEYKGEDGGKQGFDAHAQTPHFKIWEDFVEKRDPFTKPPVVNFFRTLK